MITDLVIAILAGLAHALLVLLPTTPAAPDLAGLVAGTWQGVMLGLIGQWFPLADLGVALVALVAYSLVISGLRLVAWVLALVHIAGTTG